MPLHKQYRRMPLSVQVTEEQYQWLVQAGAARQISAAAIVREAIDQYRADAEARQPA